MTAKRAPEAPGGLEWVVIWSGDYGPVYASLETTLRARSVPAGPPCLQAC